MAQLLHEKYALEGVICCFVIHIGQISFPINLSFAGLPRSGKNIWKKKFFPGQGKVREFSGWPGKFPKGLESQGI